MQVREPGVVPTLPLRSPRSGGAAPTDNRLSPQGWVTAGGGGVTPGRHQHRCHNG
ncbi:hypothetical protein I79_009025 [Cricetulus griseus]|uniref:Uncharacterized protein n=1 Tax=Cricetulus griseus TaxID=10029 RepID=G3HEN7_CRIGR|nr:hypothetical protein I79_009025 [Cricetulus griseus]